MGGGEGGEELMSGGEVGELMSGAEAPERLTSVAVESPISAVGLSEAERGSEAGLLVERTLPPRRLVPVVRSPPRRLVRVVQPPQRRLVRVVQPLQRRLVPVVRSPRLPSGRARLSRHPQDANRSLTEVPR